MPNMEIARPPPLLGTDGLTFRIDSTPNQVVLENEERLLGFLQVLQRASGSGRAVAYSAKDTLVARAVIRPKLRSCQRQRP